MIELKFNNETYQLPTCFSEVNIETYMKVVSIDNDLKEIEKFVKIISILTNLSEEDVRSIKLEQIKLISNNIQFMFKTEKFDLVDRFEIDGVKYGFNYNLDKISFGEYIDLEDFSKPVEANKNLHILMSILYRPVKNFKKKSWFQILMGDKIEDYEIQEYNSDDVIKRSELFLNKLTMDKVLGSMVFFSTLSTAIILNTQGYSGKKLKKKLIEMMKLQMNQLDG